MLKWTIRIVVILFLVLLAAVVIGVWQINNIAATAVESSATTSLGVTTEVESVQLGLLNSSARLLRLDVHNPEGFDGSFLTIDDGRIAVGMRSLMTDEIKVSTLLLDGITVNLLRKDGRSNYDPIIETLSKPSEQPATESSRTFAFDRIELRNVTLNVDPVGLPGELTKLRIQIPSIILTDVPKGDNSMELTRVASVVVASVLQAAAEKGEALPGIMGDLSSKVGGFAAVTGEAGAQAVEGVKTFMEDAKGAATELTDVASQLGEDVKAAGERLRESGDKIREMGDGLRSIGQGLFDGAAPRQNDQGTTEGESAP